MELGNALDTALELEEKGYKIYTDASEKTQNDIVRQTFEYLADQETNHIEEIKEFIEKNDPDVELKGDRLPEVKKRFNKIIGSLEKSAELSDDDIEAHEAGLRFEKEAYNFYKDQLEKAEDGKAKKFFRFLMEQEEAHYELIDKAYDYMKNPEAWYAEEEGWIEEGGGM
jgi:rubrerythrin